MQQIPGTQNVFGIYTGSVSMIEPNPFETLRQIAGGYCLSRGLHVVAKLAIADKLDEAPRTDTVEPWLPPTAPQYGCSGLLETGDPVVAIGFAMGVNTSEQGPNPNGSQGADGYYHPEDEVFMPWYMRLAPNMVSEPTQTPSANVGRFSLMGDLNPFPGFRMPATGC
jgi:hypothetical protein